MVRLGRDAVRPAPLPVRERGASSQSASRRTSSARRRTRRAAGSTRCWRCHADHRSGRCPPGALPQRGLPRPDPRRGRSEDVEVQGQHGRALAGARHLRRGRLPLVLLHLQAAVGRLPLLGGDDRRGRAAVPQAAVVTYYFYALYANAAADELGERRPRRTPAARATTSTAGRSRARRARPSSWPSAWTPTTPRPRDGRSPSLVDELSNWYVRRSRRRFWDGEAAAFARCARAC